MTPFKSCFYAALLAAVMFGTHSPCLLAQPPQRILFSNWELEQIEPLQKPVQSGDRLVFRLNPAMSAAGGSITLRTGAPFKGDLATYVDAEWKKLIQGRNLVKVESPEPIGLMDGTEGLRRSALLAGDSYIALDAYQTPGGVNVLIIEAHDAMATDMLIGTAAMLSSVARIHPLATAAAVGKEAGRTPLPSPASPATQTAHAGAAAMEKQLAIMREASAARETPNTEYDNEFVDTIDVPQKDAARIARLPTKILNDSQMAGFLREVESSVAQQLRPEARKVGDGIFKDARAKNLGENVIGNIAVGLWMLGDPEAALSLMGKAIVVNPGNADNLNNYSALLTMAGGEHLALPVLEKLNKEFPGNSTILNNIAQAWFGLGDIDKAEQYLDKALMRFPGHSQANFTKSVIAEHKGDKSGAVNAMKKSIQQGYSEEKVGQLERMGYEVSENDIPWTFTPKEQPLKLHKFLLLIPGYAKSVNESIRSRDEWDAFRTSLYQASKSLEAQDEAMQDAALKEMRKFAADGMAGKKRVSPIAMKYVIKHVTRGKLPEQLLERSMRFHQETIEVARQVDILRERLNKAHNSPTLDCSAQDAAMNAFMSEANTLWENHQSEARLKELIRIEEEWARLFMYYNTVGDAGYQALLHHIKKGFLLSLRGLNHESGSPPCNSRKADSIRRHGKLAHFEDLHCDKNINLTVPLIGSIHVNCHYMSTKYNIGGVISGTTKEDLNTGEFVRGTVEIGVKLGGGSKTLGGKDGPVSVEVEAKGGGFVEFDKNGITDVGVEAGVTAEASTSVAGTPKQSIDVGVSTRMGVNSGVSTEGSGLLQGVSTSTAWR